MNKPNENPVKSLDAVEGKVKSWMDKPLTRRDAMSIGSGVILAYRYAEPASRWLEEKMGVMDLSKSPSKETLEYVGELCENPMSLPWPQPDPISNQESLAFLKPHRHHEYHADKAGLTSLEIEGALFALEFATSVEEVIEAFDVLTRQFGAETTLAKNWRFPDISKEEREILFNNESDLSIIRRRFKVLIDGCSGIPLELLTFSRVNEVHFTEFLPPIEMANDEEVGVAAQAAMHDGRISFSLDSLYYNSTGQNTFKHEIGHLIDGVLSGSRYGAYNDESFMALNNPNFEYNSDLAVSGKMDDLGLIRSYSGKNVVEDKAVIFEEMLSGVNFYYANSNDRIIRNKYRFQIARLEENIPNIAPYLVALGYREHVGA